MKTPQWKPATRAEIESYYGPTSLPIQALVIPGAIGGLVWLPEGVFAFSWTKGASPKAILRGAWALVVMIEQTGGLVYARSDEPTSDRLLRHIGFEHLSGNLYVYRRHLALPDDTRGIRSVGGSIDTSGTPRGHA